MTDLEGVAGVLDFENYCMRGAPRFECANRLLTAEVNAAVRGFLRGGAACVTVVDGHGPGGIDPESLEPPALIQRFWPKGPYPLGVTPEYSVMAFVGQHAKAGTSFSHLAHTGSFSVLDYSINGVSIGEYGQVALCAMELGVPTIFAAGEEALRGEVESLTPGVVFCPVKRGLVEGSGACLPEKEYSRSKLAAVHLNPADACKAVESGAEEAMRKWLKSPEQFKRPEIHPPYSVVQKLRPAASGGRGEEWRGFGEKSIASVFNNLHKVG